MLRKPAALTVLTAFLVLGAGCTREVSFKQDVFPILSENCLSCHKAGGEGLVKSGLDMESYDGLMKGTKLGPIVVPGSAVGSTLVLLIERQAHPSINMPKDKPPLPEGKIDIIRKWIDQGAKNN
ncbi:MAG: hypothetical protein HZA69_01200 [Gammaproteobacteria bacterium]|nr:hypothetical protein [Gammaproteobacteria bacterium]